jgi:hypothetical protein
MFRVEGEWWNVYFGTGPDNAVLLGSIRMTIVTASQEAKGAFIQIFSDAIKRELSEITGQAVDMPGPAPAPEHERAGSA